MVQVIPFILTFHTYGTGISAGIISDLYRDYICSVLPTTIGPQKSILCKQNNEIPSNAAHSNLHICISKEQLFFRFLCIVKQKKKIRSDSKIFEFFNFLEFTK